jgi:hypothetical protein
MDGARYLEDGKLTIFKRSGVYYARLRISPGKKYVWRSLKTTHEQTAIRLGRRLLFQIAPPPQRPPPPQPSAPTNAGPKRKPPASALVGMEAAASVRAAVSKTAILRNFRNMTRPPRFIWDEAALGLVVHELRRQTKTQARGPVTSSNLNQLLGNWWVFVHTLK